VPCLHNSYVHLLRVGADHRHESSSHYESYMNIIHWDLLEWWKKKLIHHHLWLVPDSNRGPAWKLDSSMPVIDSSADHPLRILFLLQVVTEYVVKTKTWPGTLLYTYSYILQGTGPSTTSPMCGILKLNGFAKRKSDGPFDDSSRNRTGALLADLQHPIVLTAGVDPPPRVSSCYNV
jgi:hypothetical protein